MATTPTDLHCCCCWFDAGRRPKEPDGDSTMAHCNNNYSNDDVYDNNDDGDDQ